MSQTQVTPRRRWFRPQFGMRTLLIAFTLLACWAAWQGRWIEQRHRYLSEHPTAARLPDSMDPHLSAPRLLWMLGERGQRRLRVEVNGFWNQREYHRSNPGPEAAYARELFPEAVIEVIEKRRATDPGGTLWYTWQPYKQWAWGKP